ncbi:hypothetical protein HHX47_DHR9000080 [Lentinula edodes]|nr:hypothetical protein HHX47_DHR9000080 [Lentinula edodes]
MPSQPQLPRKLVREILTKPWMEGFKSSVFDANGHRLRCCIVDKKNPMNADWFIESQSHGGLFSLLDTKKTGLTSATSARYTDYTVLHEAIDTTDPLLAAEIIRLGALVDKINGRGQTPLLHALERLGDIDALYEQSRKSSSLMARLMRFDHWRARLKFIAILLIDQHADVNATVQWGGRTVTPLFFAAGIARDFDLVAILLAHGANPDPPYPASSIRDYLSGRKFKMELERFTQLISETPFTVRPPRLCPCFSGKTLSDCHADGRTVGHPYPDEFLCCCGSKKTYHVCCRLRNFNIIEYWNDKEQWLQPSQTSTLPLTISQTDPRIQAVNDIVGEETLHDLMKEITSKLDFGKLLSLPDFQNFHHEMIQKACDEDKNVDPAFAWAYSQLKFLPMPDARTRDKKSGVSRAKTYYCGWKCQKTSWEEHRKICKTPEQQEVPLPSQRAIEAFVLTRGFFMFEERLGIKDEEELWEKLSKMGLCKNI